MLAAAGMWTIVETAVLGSLIVFTIVAVSFIIHRDSQNEAIHFALPRVIPWSVAARARKTRAETELEVAKQRLWEAKHASLQKQLIYSDLEDVRFKKALEATTPRD